MVAYTVINPVLYINDAIYIRINGNLSIALPIRSDQLHYLQLDPIRNTTNYIKGLMLSTRVQNKETLKISSFVFYY